MCVRTPGSVRFASDSSLLRIHGGPEVDCSSCKRIQLLADSRHSAGETWPQSACSRSPMALARIITRFPEESRDLIENLRSRGFEVQTESPGKTSPQPADLEITIEECDAEEALQRATSVQDACAFVMPGAVTGRVRPITAIPFIPQANVEENEALGPEVYAVSAEIENLPRHSFGMEAPCAEVAEFGATAIGDLESRLLINENARAMISEPEHAAAEPQPVSPNQQPEDQQPGTISVSETAFPETEADSRAQEPELISAESQLGEGAVSAVGEISDAPRDAEPVLAESGYVQEAQVSELRAEDLQATPAVEEPQVFLSGPDDLEMQTQTVEMEDAGSHPLLSEEVHDPSFEQSPGPGSPESVELAAESIAQVSIPSSGSELLSGEEVAAQNSMREKEPSSKSRPVSDWPIWQPISAEEKARETMGPAEQQQPIYDARTSAPFAPPLQRQAVPRSTMRRVRNSRLLRHPIFTNERMFWRTATFVGVIAIGLLLGMSAHRLSPLPASLQQRSVDLQPSETKPAAIVPAELNPVTRQYRVGSRASRVPKLPAELTPPLTAATKVNLASSRQPVMRSASDSSENDTDIAQDTVVRYGSRSGSSAVAPSQQKPSVKRNSDLN